MPTPNSDFVSGAILTAQQQNNFPRGAMVASLIYTGGNQTIDSRTAVDIPNATKTFTAVSGRAYKVTSMMLGRKNSTAGYTFCNIVANSTTVSEMGMTNVAGGYVLFTQVAILTGYTGSVVVKMQAYNENANSTFFSSATSPFTIIIEDIGLA